MTKNLKMTISSPARGAGENAYDAEGGYHAVFSAGNVSIAFLNHYDGEELTVYKDCPVELDGVGCPNCDDPAETLLFALAADLGYTLVK